jgi:tetratricopeptide (TPR) repeat protein
VATLPSTLINTLPGMSGGGIFNENGELIAIHGKGDVDEKFKPSQENENVRFKTGNDLGIPIDTFVRLASNVGVNTGIAPPAVVAKSAPTAADLFVSAVAKEKNKDYRGMLADLEQALKIDPKFAKGYYGRGVARSQLGDRQGAITDYDRAIQLNPNDAAAYVNRGVARSELGDKQGAITDYDRAIQLDPNFAEAYVTRGNVRYKLRDKRGAIADLQTAANLFDRQGNKKLYQFAIDKIKKIQAADPGGF